MRVSEGETQQTFLMSCFARATPVKNAVLSSFIKAGRLYRSIKSSVVARDTKWSTAKQTHVRTGAYTHTTLLTSRLRVLQPVDAPLVAHQDVTSAHDVRCLVIRREGHPGKARGIDDGDLLVEGDFVRDFGCGWAAG